MSDQRGAVIGRGARSTVFEWVDGSVIKVPFADTPDTWAEYEFRYTRAVAALGVGVPEHRTIVEVDGRKCTVSTRVPAVPMSDQLAAEPGRAEEFGAKLAELQLSLFAVVPSLELPRQVDRLASKIRRAGIVHGVDYSSVLEFLASADPSSLVLCHGDLHPRNVLMAEDGPVVIDWFDACRGIPIVEVARSLLLFEQSATIETSHANELPDAVAATGVAYRGAMVDALDLDEDELGRWLVIQRIARVAEGLDVSPSRANESLFVDLT